LALQDLHFVDKTIHYWVNYESKYKH